MFLNRWSANSAPWSRLVLEKLIIAQLLKKFRAFLFSPSFTTSSRPTLGSIQRPIQWVPGALSLQVNLPGREADHSPPFSAEVKNEWSYTSTLPDASWRGVQLSTRITLLYHHVQTDPEAYPASEIGGCS